MPKKEALGIQRELAKLERSLGGIKDLTGLPDALFIIDVGYQKGAVAEANKLGIPVIGVVDTNHSPEGITYVIPGQRRLEPRDPPVRARHGRRDSRRPLAVGAGNRRPPRATSSSRSRRKSAATERRSRARSEKGARKPLFFETAEERARNDGGNHRSLVKELREMTGLGMMECKKALAETGGDLKKAEDLLRVKSGAKASKAAGRIAAEGVIGAYLSADGKLGALVEVNCETDFVAKNDGFPRLRRGAGRAGGEARIRPTSRRCPRSARRRDVEASARRWCRRSART